MGNTELALFCYYHIQQWGLLCFSFASYELGCRFAITTVGTGNCEKMTFRMINQDHLLNFN